MSVYNRKGGSGRSGSLRTQYNYYKRQMLKRLAKEQAFKEVRGGGTIEARIRTMFKDLTYEQTYNKGITRKKGNTTVRYTGEEAVIIRINSMKRRASKTYQSDLFIRNYLQSMFKVGFDSENIYKVEKALRSISIDKLTYLVDKNILPSIQFLYAEQSNGDEETQEILNAIKNGVSSETVKELRQKSKKASEVLERLYDIIGW